MQNSDNIENLVIPEHVAIILDGNGRWAKKRGLPRSMGHKEGCKTLEDIVEQAARLGIRYLTVYGFSTENWKRPSEEVGALMQLFRYYMKRLLKIAKANNVNLYVDLHGNYSTPEAETLSVLFNSFDRHMMDAIMNRIFVEKSTFSHAVNTEQKKGIDSPDKIKQKKSLKELMDYAREKQGSYQQDRSIVEKDPLIR